MSYVFKNKDYQTILLKEGTADVFSIFGISLFFKDPCFQIICRIKWDFLYTGYVLPLNIISYLECVKVKKEPRTVLIKDCS